MRRAILIIVLAVASTPFSLLSGIAGATKAATPPVIDRLLTPTAAQKLGFPSVAKKAVSTHKTGFKQCPTVAEVIYQNKPAVHGLIDEVFSCTSAAAAGKYTSDLVNLYPKSAAVAPPRGLGTAATYGAKAPFFAIFWTHGKFGALVVVDTAASSNNGVALLHRNDPLTPALAISLAGAALQQNAKLR